MVGGGLCLCGDPIAASEFCWSDQPDDMMMASTEMECSVQYSVLAKITEATTYYRLKTTGYSHSLQATHTHTTLLTTG